MKNGLRARMDRLFNRHGDGRAVCVDVDHGYMSDVTPKVVNLREITASVIRGGVDGILLSPGQAMRLAPLFQGRDCPALIVRSDWMNMPRLGTSNVANAVPQSRLLNQKVITAEQALSLGQLLLRSISSSVTVIRSSRRASKPVPDSSLNAAGLGCPVHRAAGLRRAVTPPTARP